MLVARIVIVSVIVLILLLMIHNATTIDNDVFIFGCGSNFGMVKKKRALCQIARSVSVAEKYSSHDCLPRDSCIFWRAGGADRRRPAHDRLFRLGVSAVELFRLPNFTTRSGLRAHQESSV